MPAEVKPRAKAKAIPKPKPPVAAPSCGACWASKPLVRVLGCLSTKGFMFGVEWSPWDGSPLVVKRYTRVANHGPAFWCRSGCLAG
eukprot:4782622-Amphidinium_carterae.1